MESNDLYGTVSQRATDKIAKKTGRPSKTNKRKEKPKVVNNGFGSKSFEKLLSRRKVKEITLDSGLEVIIQSVNIGDLYVANRTLLTADFMAETTDIVDETDDDSVIEKAATPENLAMMREIIISSVTNIPFTTKDASECSEDEAPITLLDFNETIQLFNEIMTISITEQDSDTFREDSEDDENVEPVQESNVEGDSDGGEV